MIEGYVGYKKREFCNDIECPVQLKLNSHTEGSKEYDGIRKDCKNCRAWQFHHWLNDRDYIIVRPN